MVRIYRRTIQKKKGLNVLDNHDGVITHLQPDILECEIKWALGCLAKNKARGGDGISAELFQSLKDDAVKVLHSYANKFVKLSSGHRIGIGQFSFQPQIIGFMASLTQWT